MTDARQRRAYTILRTAVRRGDLVVPDICEDCGRAPAPMRDGKRRIQGHHYMGYDRPLDVQWLCPTCHAKETPQNPRFGEQHPVAKLTEDAVREILTSPESAYTLAKRLGVSRPAVQQVRNGTGWKHVTAKADAIISSAQSGGE